MRERSARRLRDIESLCDLKTGQHARQAARRASHDTQERRLSFRYTRESVKVLCCVTTPAPYAVGRSMCMHLSKHLSPSPFRPHIALAWKTTNLPLCGRTHQTMKMKLPTFVRASVYYLLLVSVIAVRTAFARMFSLCIASVCAHAISAPLCLWFCLVLFSSVSHLGVWSHLVQTQ